MPRLLFARQKAGTTTFSVLTTISLCHLLNDLMQSLLPAIYPLLKDRFDLSFAQVGLLTLTYQATASLLQPLVGLYSDRRAVSYLLPGGMVASLIGLTTLAFAPSYPVLLAGGAMLGLGSSIFHPEASRIARLASGGAHGLAQSLFQVGGNFGASLGPLLAAFFILPRGQESLIWFAAAALGGLVVLTGLANWSRSNRPSPKPRAGTPQYAHLTPTRVGWAMTVLIVLVFSKYIYLASIASYYTFYLMHRFRLETGQAQICLFVFLAAVATGTLIGGPVGDRIGRKSVIWVSILGIVPFALALPYVGLWATVGLSAVIGFMLASAFPAIVVYAQELMPGREGMVSGLLFGLAFGAGGIGAAGLGALADRMGIDYVYAVCSFLPLIGLLAVLLPDIEERPGATHENL